MSTKYLLAIGILAGLIGVAVVAVIAAQSRKSNAQPSSAQTSARGHEYGLRSA